MPRASVEMELLMSVEDKFSGKCILLVEDEVAFAERMEGLLMTLGYNKVFVVTTLEDAIDISSSEILDVALLDVNLRDGPIKGIQRLKRFQ